MNKAYQIITSILQEELVLLKNFGVKHLGYRYFLPNGYSFGCPTSEDWIQIVNTPGFNNFMKEYLSFELSKLHNNNYSYVSRVNDRQDNVYFAELEKINLNNSFGIYNFSSNKVESFFFIHSKNDASGRDILLNNIKFLEESAHRLSKQFEQEFYHLQHNKHMQFKLDRDLVVKIFAKKKNTNSKYIQFFLNGKPITFYYREFYTLNELRKGLTNKMIAEKIGITEKSVEKYIFNLKEKLAVEKKQELIVFAQSEQFQTLLIQERM